MEKPVIFLGASLLREKIAISTEHIPELCLDVQKFNEKNAYATPRFTRPCDVSISLDIEAGVTKDGISDILGMSPIFDVKVTDLSGNEFVIPNAKISERLRVVGRVPRKLKKQLKKKHGVYWKQHHPNVERFYSISNKD
jgi:hypothetical protein